MRGMRRKFLVLVLIALGGCSFIQPSRGGGDRIYTVVKGDTIDAISRRSGVTSEEILSHNGIAKAGPLKVGQVIRIPSIGPLNYDIGEQLEGAKGGARMVSISHVKHYVGSLVFPIRGAQSTSGFGWRGKRFHEGADFAAPEGTPIYAAHDGVVVLASSSHGRYGRIVVVQGRDLITVYGHNSRNRVEVGDRVSQGDHIADVGETGRASGPHLHFETRVLDPEGRYSAVDPSVFFVRVKS